MSGSTRVSGQDPSADPERMHEGRARPSVDPDTNSVPSRLVLHLSDLYIYIYIMLKFHA